MMQRKDAPTLWETQRQFTRQARRYAQSTLHRHGETLETVLRLAAVRPHEQVLDVGTGAGFTAFALAPAAGLVIATDPTRQMLEQARRLAQEARLSERIRWAMAAAEALPIASGSLDIVTCRFATHHFHDLPLALKEFARALRLGGRAVICDVVAPESEAMIRLMNELEQKRDPTHVWNHPLSQWREELLSAAGLRLLEVAQGKSQQLFSEWVHRAGTPAATVQELIEIFSSANREARQTFEIRWEGAEIYFSWDNAVILAARPE